MAALSRRSILAAPIALGLPVASAMPATINPDTAEVDRLFHNWLAVQDEMAAAKGYTDEWIDAKDAEAIALEREIRRTAPSLQRAGVLCLFELRYGIMFLYDVPQDLDADNSTDHGVILALAVLPSLLPGLTGLVREVAGDFHAHPDREVRYSRLFSGIVRAGA